MGQTLVSTLMDTTLRLEGLVNNTFNTQIFFSEDEIFDQP